MRIVKPISNDVAETLQWIQPETVLAQMALRVCSSRSFLIYFVFSLFTVPLYCILGRKQNNSQSGWGRMKAWPQPMSRRSRYMMCGWKTNWTESFSPCLSSLSLSLARFFYICKYVNMYECWYVYMYICIYVYMYMYICMCTHICLYVFMYICICVHIYICVCVCWLMLFYILLSSNLANVLRAAEAGLVRPWKCPPLSWFLFRGTHGESGIWISTDGHLTSEIWEAYVQDTLDCLIKAILFETIFPWKLMPTINTRGGSDSVA